MQSALKGGFIGSGGSRSSGAGAETVNRTAFRRPIARGPTAKQPFARRGTMRRALGSRRANGLPGALARAVLFRKPGELLPHEYDACHPIDLAPAEGEPLAGMAEGAELDAAGAGGDEQARQHGHARRLDENPIAGARLRRL